MDNDTPGEQRPLRRPQRTRNAVWVDGSLADNQLAVAASADELLAGIFPGYDSSASAAEKIRVRRLIAERCADDLQAAVVEKWARGGGDDPAWSLDQPQWIKDALTASRGTMLMNAPGAWPAGQPPLFVCRHHWPRRTHGAVESLDSITTSALLNSLARVPVGLLEWGYL
ncbi:hypothetical protein [Salinibacterium sp. ZJ450]|uniref:hypothetical protein n=1 Tax=Salinibacterium sp. ZJ450 TaxID=2708338 RepID=UPI00142255DE|nr:hypothetical protein [Salinibacterium sp. ZJ450]